MQDDKFMTGLSPGFETKRSMKKLF